MSRYDLFISGSSSSSVNLSACFGVSEDRISIVGLPRYDIMLRNADNNTYSINQYFHNLPEYRKTVLYAPTFREYGTKTEFFPFKDGKAEMLEYLEDKKIIIFTRGHVNERGGGVIQTPTE